MSRDDTGATRCHWCGKTIYPQYDEDCYGDYCNLRCKREEDRANQAEPDENPKLCEAEKLYWEAEAQYEARSQEMQRKIDRRSKFRRFRFLVGKWMGRILALVLICRLVHYLFMHAK